MPVNSSVKAGVTAETRRSTALDIQCSVNNNNKNYTLIVADNGKGMPENVDVKDADTLGLQLIKSLIDQIGGDFEVNKEKGTKFIIEFSD